MTVAARQSKAQILEVELQKHLQAAGFKNLPLYISCDFRDDSLTVVGEHPRSLVLKAKPTFAVLEAAILEIQPEAIQQIGLCLKITGQKQPYAFHSFTMNNPVLSRPKTVEVRKKPEEKPAAETGIVLAEDAGETADAAEEMPLETDVEKAGGDEYFPNFSESSSDADPIAFKVAAIGPDIADNPFDALDMEAVTVAETPKTSPFTMLVAAGMVSLVAVILAGGYYLLSRPCVIGECTALANAKQLSDNSAKTLKTSKVASSPEEAQEQLKQAIALLEPIPAWSIHRGEAQTAIEKYQEQSQNITSAIDAARLAQSAAGKTQNPPVSEQNLQQAETLWQSAIAQLGEIPTSSPVYPYAQTKAKEYRKNLATGNRQLGTEKQAEKLLLAAKSAAQIAEAREAVAQTSQTWGQVEAGWEKALGIISEIPSNTQSYQLGRLLVPKYETKLSQARERRNVEGISENAYTQAVTLAAEARILEGKNGWFKASENWRRALSYAEQVPAATSYSQKAKPLIESYTTSLQQAEVKLREERNLQKARTDLDKTCQGKPKICDYTVSNGLIAVQMNPDYVEKLQQTFIQANNNNAVKSRQAVEKHVATLQKALEAIAENAKIPMQVYDGEGKRIASHEPK
ncbi:MAG: hypothetical protein JGK17_13480 [Microcoleus sp. PH2017_10_PVI_O_A]|uniref:hypothetical protein n=1 Tax=unclassified Microcoleus TaxID=2642155 RepID=UPI001D281E63|nr:MULTISPECIES: hypothetical protein [unclassified Microcoleus]TAE83007.1 MAG: hypothetical protein EAZ83_10470 [Oscillatoriales cyanobacterium]MCC3406574.1 hypothetical protein [Microcoleus sp. PH2017_10_PVI_O_A]MCC3460587.1 hypothetical protein [Microcoleus sp. PH2017_11_PCY_U_A]MCC3479078.1 hypothetical protein [Microcoleus sp. PH2017_12_PCY_D_A]MCC3528916.1 hypothetical protein [Microcoleus sp. PH2017_21_RUC_O_A]